MVEKKGRKGKRNRARGRMWLSYQMISVDMIIYIIPKNDDNDEDVLSTVVGR